MDKACITKVGSIAHELGHVVGLFHEHIRSDRDQFIEMHFDNIKSNRISDYTQLTTTFTYSSTPYDLGSIMHYAPINGDSKVVNTSVFTLRGGVVFSGTIGQRECLSYFDIEATNSLYNCNMPCEFMRSMYDTHMYCW